jgi:hypothetical protein
MKRKIIYTDLKYGIMNLFLLIMLAGCSTAKVDSFDSIIEKRSNKTYILKQGRFKVNRPFLIPSGIKLVGNNTTILIDNSHPFPIFQLMNVKKVEISNLTIEGKPLVYTDNKDYLQKVNYFHVVNIINCYDIALKEIEFINIEGTGIKALDAEKIKIEKCSFTNFGHSSFKDVGYSSDGIYLGGDRLIKNISIDSCIFNNIGMSFPQGNYPWPNDGDGIQILTSGYAKDISITNSEFYKCSARAIKIQSGNNVLVDNNTMTNCGSAVSMPMRDSMSDIIITNNVLNNMIIAFGSDKGGDTSFITNLIIKNNIVDSCKHFFRTSGYSNVRNGYIKNNIIGKVGQFVISGRFFNYHITGNTVEGFATENHPDWNMALLMSPESENVTIEGNRFGGNTRNKVLIDNRSKNKITLKNNSINNQ